jgi:LuxR family transcriptional regulator, maltose regulon positive regulatory protein
MKNCAMALVKRGDLLTLLGWQRLFPMVSSSTELKLAIAWGLALAIRIEEALELLQQIENEIDDEPSPENAELAVECTTIRSVAIALADNSLDALSLAENCVGKSNDPWTANIALDVIHWAYLKAGDLAKFYATPWIPYSLDENRRNVFQAVMRCCFQGLAEAQQIHLTAAERYYLEAVALAEQYVGPNSAAAAAPFSLLAQIRYERGQMAEADDMLFDRIPILTATAMLDCIMTAYFVLVRLAAWRMNFSRAYTLLEQAENLGLTRRWGRLVAGALLERVRLCCLEGRISESVAYLDRLNRIAEEHPTPKLCAWSDTHRYSALASAHVALAQNEPQSAISILKNLEREADDAHSYYFGLRITAHLATAYFRAGERANAQIALRKGAGYRNEGGSLSDDPRSGFGYWHPAFKRSGKRGSYR